jgi:hypothetical protein
VTKISWKSLPPRFVWFDERLHASAITARELARASKLRRVLIRAAAPTQSEQMDPMQRNSG